MIHRRRRVHRFGRRKNPIASAEVLAAGLGHDINNLLMVVLAGTDVVSDPRSTRGELVRAAADIEDAAQRAAVIARQLVALGRGAKRGAVSIVRAADELRRLEPTLSRAVGPKVRVAMSITSELPTIVDGDQLGQAILNLAVNARDAMPEGGDIRIDATDVVVDRLDAAVPLPGRYVAIAVEDTGVGMDEATLSRATEPYFTTKPEGQGSGLGLAMVDDIVRQHGGYVDIQSRRGEGTKITLYLPAFAA